MKKNIRLGLHVLLIGVIAAVVVAARFLLADRNAEESKRLGQISARETAHRRVAFWKSLQYTPVNRPDFAGAFLSRIDWQGLDLRPIQADTLRGRLVEVLAYLEKPDLQEYLRLKRQGLHYDFRPSKACAEALQGYTGGWASYNPDDLIREAWGMASTNGAGGVFGLTSVCLSEVAARTTSINTPESLLLGRVKKGFTWAREVGDPGFLYDVGSEPLYLHLSFFGRTGGEQSAGPIYISLCWVPRDNSWGLSRLVVDASLQINALF